MECEPGTRILSPLCTDDSGGFIVRTEITLDGHTHLPSLWKRHCDCYELIRVDEFLESEDNRRMDWPVVRSPDLVSIEHALDGQRRSNATGNSLREPFKP
ncbi:hypothetical protein TNCV_4167871 [Trichonephila clavipes]|nr:hypothetical protein TNCV_4167871 [Trichonephila clavipes]